MSHLPYLARMIASVALLGTAVLKLGSGHDAAIATPVPLYYGSAITELVLAGLLWTRLSRASCILGGALFVLAALWAMMQTPSHWRVPRGTLGAGLACPGDPVVRHGEHAVPGGRDRHPCNQTRPPPVDVRIRTTVANLPPSTRVTPTVRAETAF